MSGKIYKRDRAKAGIIEIAVHLAADSALDSARFIDAVERTVEFLVAMLEIAGRWESDLPRLQGIRVWQVDGFPNHLLFYRPIPDGIDLIFVCHAARDLENLLKQL